MTRTQRRTLGQTFGHVVRLVRLQGGPEAPVGQSDRHSLLYKGVRCPTASNHRTVAKIRSRGIASTGRAFVTHTLVTREHHVRSRRDPMPPCPREVRRMDKEPLGQRVRGVKESCRGKHLRRARSGRVHGIGGHPGAPVPTLPHLARPDPGRMGALGAGGGGKAQPYRAHTREFLERECALSGSAGPPMGGKGSSWA